MFPSPHSIIHTSNHQNTAEHDNAPVHIRDIRRVDDGEEARNASHGHVEDGEEVDGDAEFAEGEAGSWEGFVAEAFLEDAFFFVLARFVEEEERGVGRQKGE